MIRRDLEPVLRRMARQFPVVTITGPRQAGKTTLCRAVFPDRPYRSLEAPDVREYAVRDPRGFLGELRDGAILDEVQRVPDLLSYIQGEVDERPTAGRFILTGSANFALLQSITQSLAGRTALLELLPLGFDEVRRFPNAPTDLWDVLWRGAFPSVYDRQIDPTDWLRGYVGTYVERDVRALLKVGDVTAFQTFLRLAAGRTAQLLNLSALGADAGVSHNTARAWVSVLETSYLAARLLPWHASHTSRLVKTPKLHLCDTGLVCYLLGMRSPSQLREHPLRGAIFETWVHTELVKMHRHHGESCRMSFFRDRKGAEVDMIVERADEALAIETKSGATVANDFFKGLEVFARAAAGRRGASVVRSVVVYGGGERQRRARGDVIPWTDIGRLRPK